MKDAERDSQGNLAFDADLLARVYEGTDGVRMLQTNSHFWQPMDPNPCACEKCGSSKLTRKLEPASRRSATISFDLPPGNGGGENEATQRSRSSRDHRRA